MQISLWLRRISIQNKQYWLVSTSYSIVFFFLLIMPLLTSGYTCSILYDILPLSSVHALTTQWTKKSVLHTNINLYLHLLYTDNNLYIKGGNYRYKTYDTMFYYCLNFLFCRYFGAYRSCRRRRCVSHVARYAIILVWPIGVLVCFVNIVA